MKAANIPFEEINIGGKMKSPEMLAINPRGLVPFITIGDKMLSESGAILTYLAQKYPQANKYYPSDIKTRYLVDKALDFHGSTFRPAFVNILSQYFSSGS